MGCLGLAAPLKSKEPLTYFADEYGGNMDFYKVTKGATIYHHSFTKALWLYIGDGHAAQGDGELNGDALETSMDFAFVARVIKGQAKIAFPRIEDSEHMFQWQWIRLSNSIKKATLDFLNGCKKI